MSSSSSKSAEAIIESAAKILTSKLPSAARSSGAQGACDAFEIFYSKSRSVKIESKNLKVESLTSAADIGLAFRVQKDGRVGFSYTTSIAPEAIEGAIQNALAISEHMNFDETKTLQPFSEALPLAENRFDEEGLKRNIEEKVELAFQLEAQCKAIDRRIQTVRSASIAESESEVILFNHLGQRLSMNRTNFSASISCKAEENGDAQMGGDYQFSSFLKDLPIALTAKNSAETATEHLGATLPTTRVCPGIIRNNVVAELLEFLSSSFFGEEIQKGRSMLKDRLNSPIASPLIHIVDDGRLKGGLASRAFDAEGSDSQTTTLVRNGVFERMLFDRASAAHFKLPSTGNSARSLKAPPSTSLSNLYLKGGDTAYEKLILTLNNGIIITDLMGVHTANPITGSFSLGATGLLVENGKITRPVKGFAVAGNVLDIFKNASILGSDLRFFGNLGACSLLLPEVSVSGA
jgi:PmbA protein